MAPIHFRGHFRAACFSYCVIQPATVNYIGYDCCILLLSSVDCLQELFHTPVLIQMLSCHFKIYMLSNREPLTVKHNSVLGFFGQNTLRDLQKPVRLILREL